MSTTGTTVCINSPPTFHRCSRTCTSGPLTCPRRPPTMQRPSPHRVLFVTALGSPVSLTRFRAPLTRSPRPRIEGFTPRTAVTEPPTRSVVSCHAAQSSPLTRRGRRSTCSRKPPIATTDPRTAFRAAAHATARMTASVTVSPPICAVAAPQLTACFADVQHSVGRPFITPPRRLRAQSRTCRRASPHRSTSDRRPYRWLLYIRHADARTSPPLYFVRPVSRSHATGPSRDLSVSLPALRADCPATIPALFAHPAAVSAYAAAIRATPH
jgi:hypothetical protein